MDGTISEIARIALPMLEDIMDVRIAVRPLTEFRNWAARVPVEEIDKAYEF